MYMYMYIHVYRSVPSKRPSLLSTPHFVDPTVGVYMRYTYKWLVRVCVRPPPRFLACEIQAPVCTYSGHCCTVCAFIVSWLRAEHSCHNLVSHCPCSILRPAMVTRRTRERTPHSHSTTREYNRLCNALHTCTCTWVCPLVSKHAVGLHILWWQQW